MVDLEAIIIEVLVLLVIFGGLGLGVFYLTRQNREKTARSQAMFGVGPSGPAPGGRPAVVVGKRSYTWSDRIGYYITFQPDGAPAVEVEVSLEWFGYLNPGDRGQVALENNQFYGFTKVS